MESLSYDTSIAIPDVAIGSNFTAKAKEESRRFKPRCHEAQSQFGFSHGLADVMEGMRGYTWATFEEKAREMGMNETNTPDLP